VSNINLIFVSIVLCWFLTTGISLYLLIKKRHVSEIAQIIWTLVIILIPFLGPVAFALVTYNKRTQQIHQNENKEENSI
jgi:hypothetical protein